jgi:exosortase/archaeosortase family protein
MVTSTIAEPSRTRLPRLSRFVSGPAFRLVVGSAVAVWLFIHLVDPTRDLEARMVAWTLNLAGGPTVYALPGGRLVDIGGPSVFIGAEITRSCSALSIALGAAVVAFALFRCSWRRRLAAIAAAVIVAETVNVVRIATTLVVGRTHGVQTMVAYHNLIGTAVTVIGAAAAFAVMVAIAGPGGQANRRKRTRASMSS